MSKQLSKLQDYFKKEYNGIHYDFYHVDFLTWEVHKNGGFMDEFASSAEARHAAMKDAGFDPANEIKENK